MNDERESISMNEGDDGRRGEGNETERNETKFEMLGLGKVRLGKANGERAGG